MSVLSSTSAPDRAGRIDPVRLLGQFAPFIFLLVLIVVFASLNPRFLLPLNLWNILRQVSITGLIAIGMTFVILTAGIDLSVGSLLALAGLVCADIYKGGTFFNRLFGGLGLDASGLAGSVAIAAGIAMLIGVTGGLLQGLAITRLGVPAFVVTLGGLSIWRGLALQYSNGGPISTFDASYNFWGQGRIAELGDVPVPVIIFLIFALLAHIILRYTRYGRHVYAVGGNPEAARLSGLPVRRLVLSVYVIVGFFAGLGGFVLSSRLNSSEAVAGVGYELTVIASVVIGGTSLFGGRGSVLGTVVGSVLIGVLNNGLVLMNVSSYVQQVVIGVIIILAVAFDQFIKSRQRR
jgi:ribose/xylose/arabinose/galactoside ABC-type transport system permease subunit